MIVLFIFILLGFVVVFLCSFPIMVIINYFVPTAVIEAVFETPNIGFWQAFCLTAWIISAFGIMIHFCSSDKK